ncbi:MAG: aldo/keto reductase [Paracoccaceae bacterium]|nr:MAG: aldo/keto reductase [Paracoccaceae bacterium]
MRRIPLGHSGIEVSEVCLGTMTWGSQTTTRAAHDQIALALERGVTFWDTAEMYPTNPVRAETVGETERIIGTWFAREGGREHVQLATKISGAGQAAVRDGAPITGAQVRASVDASLARLQTDYIDLYQLHWPNRGSYHFRRIWGYVPPSDRASAIAHMDDVLGVAADLIAEGKLRAIGVSNETVWGASQWIARAEVTGGPRMMTVQNEYSLLCRQFDSDWAEFSAMENMPLMAFSPLAAGLLSGKYAGDVTPEGTRRSITPDLGGRITPQVFPAVAAYLGIAARHGIDPCAMAIAFVRTRPFPCIPILGATTLDHLATNIGAVDLELTPEVMAEIALARRDHPMPY